MSKDLSKNIFSFLLLWGLPIVLIVFSNVYLAERGVTVAGIVFSGAILWMGVGCIANAFRCKRAHCVLLGPFLIVIGLLGIGITAKIINISWDLLSTVLIIGVVAAFIPECLGKKYFGKNQTC